MQKPGKKRKKTGGPHGPPVGSLSRASLSRSHWAAFPDPLRPCAAQMPLTPDGVRLFWACRGSTGPGPPMLALRCHARIGRPSRTRFAPARPKCRSRLRRSPVLGLSGLHRVRAAYARASLSRSHWAAFPDPLRPCAAQMPLTPTAFACFGPVGAPPGPARLCSRFVLTRSSPGTSRSAWGRRGHRRTRPPSDRSRSRDPAGCGRPGSRCW